VPERRHPARVRIREVRDPEDRMLGRAHGLLKRIFPRAELSPLGAWRESLRERAAGLWTDLDWHLLVAQQGRRLVGAASGSYIGNVNVGLVGYVAVLKELRGRGVGERMRHALRAAIGRDALRIHGRPLEALIGEVHTENRWLRHLVREKAALALDFPYCQPSLHRAARHVELVLYYEPLTRRRHTLPADEVRRLVYTMWRRIYRIDRPLGRRLFRRMLRALPRGRRVGSRPYRTLGPDAAARASH
jgi:Acetyltransferase (GNAT) family